jgi:hypothetical protein
MFQLLFVVGVFCSLTEINEALNSKEFAEHDSATLQLSTIAQELCGEINKYFEYCMSSGTHDAIENYVFNKGNASFRLALILKLQSLSLVLSLLHQISSLTLEFNKSKFSLEQILRASMTAPVDDLKDKVLSLTENLKNVKPEEGKGIVDQLLETVNLRIKKQEVCTHLVSRINIILLKYSAIDKAYDGSISILFRAFLNAMIPAVSDDAMSYEKFIDEFPDKLARQIQTILKKFQVIIKHHS